MIGRVKDSLAKVRKAFLNACQVAHQQSKVAQGPLAQKPADNGLAALAQVVSRACNGIFDAFLMPRQAALHDHNKQLFLAPRSVIVQGGGLDAQLFGNVMDRNRCITELIEQGFGSLKHAFSGVFCSLRLSCSCFGLQITTPFWYRFRSVIQSMVLTENEPAGFGPFVNFTVKQLELLAGIDISIASAHLGTFILRFLYAKYAGAENRA